METSLQLRREPGNISLGRGRLEGSWFKVLGVGVVVWGCLNEVRFRCKALKPPSVNPKPSTHMHPDAGLLLEDERHVSFREADCGSAL